MSIKIYLQSRVHSWGKRLINRQVAVESRMKQISGREILMGVHKRGEKAKRPGSEWLNTKKQNGVQCGAPKASSVCAAESDSLQTGKNLSTFFLTCYHPPPPPPHHHCCPVKAFTAWHPHTHTLRDDTLGYDNHSQQR